MGLRQLSLKLKSFYLIFIASPKKWRFPSKTDILIYDACGSENFVPYFGNYSHTTLCLRGESINIPCFFYSMASVDFWKRNPLAAYISTYIKKVSPTIIITFIDNNNSFYKLSKQFPECKTIFVQNGSRSEAGDIFSNLSKSALYHVDYMLVHSRSIGKHYSKYISGQYISFGSLKNNAVKKINGVGGNTVLFISHTSGAIKGDMPLYIHPNGMPIYHNQYFFAEAMVLKFLDSWCVKNNKQLKICGRSDGLDGKEKAFYANLINESKWELIPKLNNFSSYKLIDLADIVVTIDSTLGYESIGRGKKTAAFSCRASSILSQAANFGWPLDLPNNGPFWTNDHDVEQFQRIMDYLSKVSDVEWKRTLKRYSLDLMDFNPDNKLLVNLLNQLLLRKKGRFNVN
jgi:surface carbohydrate biosynthesis protein